MLDFLLQTAGIAAGLGLGSCLYGWSQAKIAVWMGDPTPMQEGTRYFWSWEHLAPLGALGMFIVQVGWPRGNILRPQASPSPRITMLLSVLIPTLLLLLAALLGATFLKLLLFMGPNFSLLLESFIRTLITLALTLSLPIPPLEGWRLLSVLVTGEIRPGNKLVFPALLLCFFVLELLTKFSIIDVFFGPLTDKIFLFLYLLG